MLQQDQWFQYSLCVSTFMKQDNAESASNLLQDYEDMLKDLSLLQKKDRRLRKKMLSQIPVSIQTLISFTV